MSGESDALRRMGERARQKRTAEELAADPGPVHCGKELAGGAPYGAYYTRPSTTARYFGLRITCDECWRSLAIGADYIVGEAAQKLHCGDWVTEGALQVDEDEAREWYVLVKSEPPPA